MKTSVQVVATTLALAVALVLAAASGATPPSASVTAAAPTPAASAAPGLAVAGAARVPAVTSPADVLAIIGPTTLTRAEFDAMFAMSPPQLRQKGQRSYLDELVRFRTLLEAAKRKGLDRSSAVQARLAPRLREQMARLAFEEARLARPAVTEADVRRVYEERKALLIEPEAISVTRLPGQSEQDARGFRTVVQLAGGIDKLGAQLKARVQDLGAVHPGSVPADLHAFLQKQAVGAISEPFQSNGSWACYLVTSRRPERPRSFDEVKDSLRRQLQSERDQHTMESLLAEGVKRFPIELHPERLDDPDAQAVVAVIGTEKLQRQDVLAEIARAQGLMRDYLTRDEGRRQLLENLARRSCLAQMAAADPAIERKYGRQLRYMQEREVADTLLEEDCYRHVRIDDAEARKYYQENLAKFGREQSLSSHILFAKRKGDPVGRARQALARIRQGEEFHTLARELSDDAATREKGGEIGWFGRGFLVAPYEQAAFSMQVGQVSSQPVESLYGAHVIMVEGHREAVPFEQVREAVVTELTERRRKDAYDRFVLGIRKELQVKVMPESLPPDPVPAQDPRSLSMMRITITSEGTIQVQPAQDK
ncbi:MAG: peptidyl-prolyl cis-trans isomerase [Candidatus Riflebacteria bacterium]|nr:peptidyl-prolyl cis-trans isomerase [Candidatus Riflebacteria bacterium]